MDRHKDHFRGRHYEADNIHGPLSFLNPTTRRLPVHRPHAKPTAASSSSSNDGPTQVHTLDGDAEDGTDKLPIVEGEGEAPGLQKEEPHTGVYHVWRSRDNRKGRHALALTPSASRVALPPPARDSFSSTARGILKMLTRYPVWDVSYDVATVFTWGSVVWVINGFFEWLPLVSPSTEFPTEETWGGGLTAFIGATIFLFGSVLLMLEAVNENRSDCFGWALEDAMERESGGGLYQLKQEASGCRHHHGEKRAFLTRKNDSGTDVGKDDEDGDSSQSSNGGSGGKGGRKWQWWPSWHELKTHYFRDIGFLACFSQMCGASIFWIAGLTGIPTILNSLSVPAENGIYWLPQVSYPIFLIPVSDPPPIQVCIPELTPVPSTGHRRHRLHHLKPPLHARDAAEVVHTSPEDPGLAHRILEFDRGDRIHPLWRPRICERATGYDVCPDLVYLYWIVGFPGEYGVRSIVPTQNPAGPTSHRQHPFLHNPGNRLLRRKLACPRSLGFAYPDGRALWWDRAGGNTSSSSADMCSFLQIGSVIQWYESLDKYTVTIAK